MLRLFNELFNLQPPNVNEYFSRSYYNKKIDNRDPKIYETNKLTLTLSRVFLGNYSELILES